MLRPARRRRLRRRGAAGIACIAGILRCCVDGAGRAGRAGDEPDGLRSAVRRDGAAPGALVRRRGPVHAGLGRSERDRAGVEGLTRARRVAGIARARSRARSAHQPAVPALRERFARDEPLHDRRTDRRARRRCSAVTISPGEIAALGGIAVLGSIVFGITGFGAALVTIPLATHMVSLPFALALFVLMDLANAFRIGFENPKNAVRAEWTRMVPTIVLGTGTG